MLNVKITEFQDTDKPKVCKIDLEVASWTNNGFINFVNIIEMEEPKLSETNGTRI